MSFQIWKTDCEVLRYDEAVRVDEPLTADLRRGDLVLCDKSAIGNDRKRRHIAEHGTGFANGEITPTDACDGVDLSLNDGIVGHNGS